VAVLEGVQRHERFGQIILPAVNSRDQLALSLGTLYHKTGRPQQARAELSTAIALYRAMDMTFWLPQAEAALAQVA
jgi:hypothetical protein